MNQRGFPILGAYLRRRRLEAGMTLRDVEDVTDGHAVWSRLPFGTLAKIEKGDTEPTLGALITLSQLYSVPLHALVDQVELDRASAQAPRRASAQRLRELGRAALAAHDAERAVACFAHALRTLQRRPDGGGPPRTLAQKLHIDLAIACRQRGAHRVAEEVLRELVGARRREGPLTAYALYLLAQVYLDGEQLFLARAAAAEAERRAPEGPLRHAIQGLAAAVEDMEGRLEDALAGYRAAIAGLYRHGHTRAATIFVSDLAHCLVRLGRARQGEAVHDKALAKLAAEGDPWVLCRAQIHYAESLVLLGRWRDAVPLLLEAKRLSVQAGSEFLQFHVRFHLREIARDHARDDEEARFHWTAMERLRPRIQVRSREVRRFDEERLHSAVGQG